MAGIAAAVLVLGGAFYWSVIKPLGEGTVCYVTETSIAIDSVSGEASRYSFEGDAPESPEPGDRYFCSSGGLPGEVICFRAKRIIGYDLEDCQVISA